MRFLWKIILLLMLPTAGLHGTEVLTLEAVINRIQEHNPELKVARYQSMAAEKQVDNAWLAPPFRASLDVENIAGNGNRDGVDAIETTLSLGKVIEFGDKPGLRGEHALQQSLQVRNIENIKRIDVLALGAHDFVQLVKYQELIKVESEALSLAQQTMASVQRRVAAGRAAKAELRRAKIARTRAELNLARAKQRYRSGAVKLSSLWGKTTPDFDRAGGDLFDIQRVETFSQYESLIVNSPLLVQAASEKRLAHAYYSLISAEAVPDIEFHAGVRHFQESDDVGLVLSASIPLASKRRAVASMDAARIALESEPFQFERQKLKLTATLYEIHQQLQFAYENVIGLREQIIPQAKQALKDYQGGYSAGRYSFIELTTAQQELLAASYEYINAAADYHRNRIELERLTGMQQATGAGK